MTWSPDQLERLDVAHELEIAAQRPDGSLRDFTPIWVVRAGDEVFVRTWHARPTGWYGAATATGRARIRVPGLELDVQVARTALDRRAAIDDAYRAKYGGGSTGGMTTDESAATTLQLNPA